ncbi:MAG: zinc-binding dehydrogenase, partial [Chloroflexota bacterium]
VAGDTTSGGADGFDQVSDDSTGSWGGLGVQFPRIQGADVVGHVVALGNEVDESWLDARVISDNWLRDWSEPMNRNKTGYLGSECDGGFAQYVALPTTNLGQINSDWSDAELATLSCSYTTAENMLGRARVTGDDTVLITGASGGVGSALIQLVKRRGATAIALTNAAKADKVLAVGADAVIRRGVDDWQTVIQRQAPSGKVTVAADVVGGPVFASLLSVLARGGRYVTSGAIGGKKVELDISHLYLKDWELIGSTITATHVFSDLIRYVEANEIKPLLAATFPLVDIQQAQEAFLAKEYVGKMVIIPPQ